MINSTKSKPTNGWVILLSIVYLLHGMPALGYLFPSIAFAAIVIVLFIGLMHNLDLKDLKTLTPLFVIPILNPFIFFVQEAETLRFLMNLSGLMQLTIYTLLAYVLIKNRDYKNSIRVFTVYLILTFFTAFTTYKGCLSFPEASRALAVTDVENTNYYLLYSGLNIGGFSFIYTLVLITPLAVVLFNNRNLFKKHILIIGLSIAAIVLIGFTLIAAEYTTALLMYFLSLCLLLMNKHLNVQKLIFSGVICAALFFAAKPVISQILLFASQNIESNSVSSRLTDLAMVIEGKDTESKDSDLDSRKDKYNNSFNSFASNPIGSWGTYEKGIGGHSYLFDNLARFGVFALLFIYLMIKKIYTLYIRPNKHKPYYGYEVVMLIFYCILFVVNPGTFYVSLTFVMPLFFFLFDKYKISQ